MIMHLKERRDRLAVTGHGLRVFVVLSWAAFAPVPQGAIGGDEAKSQSSRFMVRGEIESVTILNANEYSQMQALGSIVSNSMGYNGALRIVRENWKNVTPIDVLIGWAFGKLVGIIDPLKTAGNRHNPCRTSAKVFETKVALRRECAITRQIFGNLDLEQPSPLATDSNFSLSSNGDQEMSSGNDVSKRQNNHEHVCALSVSEPSDETFLLAYILGGGGGLLLVWGILYRYGLGWGFRSLSRLAISARIGCGLFLLFMGLLLGLFGLQMAQCVYGAHQNRGEENPAHESTSRNSLSPPQWPWIIRSKNEVILPRLLSLMYTSRRITAALLDSKHTH